MIGFPVPTLAIAKRVLDSLRVHGVSCPCNSEMHWKVAKEKTVFLINKDKKLFFTHINCHNTEYKLVPYSNDIDSLIESILKELETN